MTGVIGVSEPPVSNPSRASSALKRLVFAHRRSCRWGSSCMHADRLAARGDDGRRMGRREQERPCPLDEDVAQRLAAGDVATQRPDGLRQRPDLDRDPAVRARSGHRAAPVPAQDAARHARRRRTRRRRTPRPPRRSRGAARCRRPSRTRRRSRRGSAGTAVPSGRPCSRGLPQHRAQRLDVLVREDLARRLRQAHAVDDRGVVQLVARRSGRPRR